MVFGKKLYSILEQVFIGILIAVFLLLIFSVDFFTEGKFIVIQLYGIPVILAALFYGNSGVLNTSIASSVLISFGLYYYPGDNLVTKAVSLGMFGFLILFANSLARIKASLDLKNKSLEIKSEALNLHVAQLKVINQLGHKLIGSTALQDITNLALKAIIKLLKVDKASVIIDEGDDMDVYVAHIGFNDRSDLRIHLMEFWKLHKTGILRTKKDAVINLKKKDATLEILSVIGAPIESENKVIGFIAGYSSDNRKFSSNEIAFLNVLAEEIGIAVKNSNLHENLSKRAIMLESLVDVSRTLSSSFRLDKIYSKLADIAATAVGADGCKVILGDEETQEVLIAASKIDNQTQNKKVRLDENSYIFKAMNRKKTISMNDPIYNLTGEEAHFVIRSIAKSILIVPIIFEGGSIGVIYFDSIRPGFSFSKQDKILARAIADQAALLINRATVYEELSQTAKTSSVLAESGALLIKSISLDDRLSILIQRLRETLHVSEGGILLGHDKSKGLNEKEYNYLKNKIVSTGGIILKKNSTSSDSDIEQKWLSSLSAESMLALPICYQNSCLGIAIFYEPQKYIIFEERQVLLARHIIDYSAVAIHTAKLYESIEKLRAKSEEKASNLSILFNVAQTISSSLKTKTVLARTINSAKQMFDAETVILMLYDEALGELVMKMNIGVDNQEIENFRIKPPNDFIGTVFTSGKAAKTVYDKSNCKDLIMSMHNGELLSAAAAPLITMGKEIGVISLYSKEINAFSKNDLELLSILASQVALSIETASKYEKEHHIVETLQRSLLPKKPTFEDMEIGVLYSPARHQSEVGGDYYDFISLEDGVIGVIIGDVCGKGIDAATETAMARYYLQAFASQFKDPATVLSHVNRTITKNYDIQLITMIYLVIDIKNKLVRYANAGHPPAFIMDSNRNIKFLRATGPIVGAIDKAHFYSRELQLAEGDLIFLYTDGVTETQRNGEFFGEERLTEILKNLNGLPMNALVNDIYKTVVEWGNNITNDDIALVGLKISKQGENKKRDKEVLS